MNIVENLRKINGISQKELSIAIGVSQPTVSEWEHGKKDPSGERLEKLSKFFGVSKASIICLDDPAPVKETAVPENAFVRVPVLGSIPAGVPFEAIQNVEDYEDLPAAMINPGAQYFGLRVKGDSMEPEYLDGDTIILQRAEECNSGEDCAVMINGDDATFKRVRLQENGLTLQPLNHKYEPRFFTAREVREIPVRIVGICVEVRRRIRRK